MHLATTRQNKQVQFQLNTLLEHAVIVGSTGSGKTVLGKALLEQALASNLKVIAIDPKGDLGGLAIIDKAFDFRPFNQLTTQQATIVSAMYQQNTAQFPVKQKEADIQALAKKHTKIYTPKSKTGIQVSFLPPLDPPKTQSEILAESIAQSLLSLASISTAQKPQYAVFVSSLITHYWQKQEQVTLQKIIHGCIQPPITHIGDLPIQTAISASEQKKIATALNTISTSPSKALWSQGEIIDFGKLCDLSIFDLRSCTSQEEKQFATEFICMQLYKQMIQLPGTDKIHTLLYIDELAGILPPPPANPPSKKILELLIRQARAFGIGIVLATQNPGDIDYKMLANIRTRFLGKLRSENDIAKVSVGLGLLQVKEQLAQTTAGEFMYADEVQNTTVLCKTRWLYSYHCGPLSTVDIQRINSNEREKPTDSLKKTTSIPEQVKTNQKTQTVQELIQSFKPYVSVIDVKKTDNKKVYKPFARIVGVIDQQTFVGPYTFDLSTKLIHEQTIIRQGLIQAQGTEEITQVHASIPKLIEYVQGFGLAKIPQLMCYSTITNYHSPLFDAVVEHNKAHLHNNYTKKRQHIQEIYERKSAVLQDKQKILEKQASQITSRQVALASTRILKRIFTTRKIQQSTKEQQQLARKKEKLARQKEQILLKKKQVLQQQKKALGQFETLVQKLCEKKVKKVYSKPKPSQITLKVTILLT
jgi:hypothetical protein